MLNVIFLVGFVISPDNFDTINQNVPKHFKSIFHSGFKNHEITQNLKKSLISLVNTSGQMEAKRS